MSTTVILLDRDPDADLEQPARTVVEGCGSSVRVRTLTGRDAGPAGVLDALTRVESELVAVFDAGELVLPAGAARLADELEAEDTVVACRILSADGARIAFDLGAFDAERLACCPAEGLAAASAGRGVSTWFDPRAFAARREPLLQALGTRFPASDGDCLGIGLAVWLAGGRVVSSAGTDAVLAETARPLPHDDAAAIARVLAEHLEPATYAVALAALHPPEAAAVPLDELLANRRTAQQRRGRSDASLLAELGPLFSLQSRAPAAPAVAPRQPARPRRRQLAVLCSDMLGESMAGPAIRAVETGRALADEFDVVLAVRAIVGRAAPLPFEVCELGSERLDRLLAASDAVVVQGPATDWYPGILRSDTPLAIDLYDPMNLEALEAREADALVPYTVGVLADQIRRGDFFLCASDRQRDYWLGMLAALGRITPEAYADDPDLRTLIDVVPFGIPGEDPVRTAPGVRGVVAGIAADDPLFVWNGGLWDWFDPDTFVRAIDLARRRVPNIRGFFMGTKRPDSPAPTEAAVRCVDLARRLGLADEHVFFADWTPYETRQNVYLDATAVVSLHAAHIETRFSFRTRLLDCIWAGVPIVCTEGDILAGLVQDESLGLTAAPGDATAVAEAMVALAEDEAHRSAIAGRLRALAPAYRWSSTVEPLRQWARRARRGDGRPPAEPRRSAPPPPPDARVDPPPGSLKLLLPRPVRQHVMGPAKRSLQRAATRAGGA